MVDWVKHKAGGERIRIARSLLARGLDPQLVIEATGVTAAEVALLRRNP